MARRRRRGRTPDVTTDLDDILATKDLGVTGTIERLRRTEIATLWAGYGTLERLEVVSDTGDEATYVLKNIRCPPGAAGFDLKRKLASYRNEKTFYARVAPQLPSFLRVPRPVCLLEHGDRIVLVLEDISSDFVVGRDELSDAQLRTALEWLAGFHARFWEAPHAHPGMAACGSYWHLDIRPQEFAHLTGARWQRCRNAAAAVDARLQGCVVVDGRTVRSKRHLTLIHGDFKPANIRFARDGGNCVVYDFQYCGRGYGVRDLCYLLFGRLPWSRESRALVEHYHRHLCAHLGEEHRDYSLEYALSLCRLAVLDFYRFLAGWQYVGRTPPRWLEQTMGEVLTTLDDGETLSPDGYAAAMATRYPLPPPAGPASG